MGGYIGIMEKWKLLRWGYVRFRVFRVVDSWDLESGG